MAYKHVIRAKTRNLFDISNADITQHSGYWTSKVDFTEHFYTQIVEPGKTYTVSYECYNPAGGEDSLSLSVQTGSGFYDGTRLYTGLLTKGKYNWVKFRGVFTIPNGITQVTFSAFLLTMFRNFQLEEGSTPTPYTPYNYLQSNKRMIKVSDVCQLLDKSIYPATTTNKGITITNNGDGSVTLNGTATSDGQFYSLQYINLINGHKYFICDNQGSSFTDIVFTLDALGSAGNREGNIYTFNITSGPLRRNAYFWVASGTVISNRVYKPQIFDLTEMYGAGHEPATVAEFRQRFPNELYPYSPQCWLTSYKSAVVCKTKNLFNVNNAVPYNFVTDNYDSNLVWLKDGVYTTRLNNYNIGSGLRIKNGWSLPAGAYTVSVKIVDFNNIENFVIGFRYKTTDGTWKVSNYFYWSANYKVGDTIALAVTLPENTDVRLYMGYQNDNGQYLTGYVSYKDIQLEQGSTATSYVPYQHL
jgi:hypothetical protein